MVLVNQCLAIFGKGLPFTNDFAYQAISVILTIGTGLWTALKNNDFTKAARTAGKVFDALKDGKITTEEAESLLESADKIVSSEDDISSNKEEISQEDLEAEDVVITAED